MVRVENAMGLHMRPADMIVKLVSSLDVQLTIRKGALEVDAASILSILSLSAGQGEELELIASGPDSEAALTALVDLFSRGFDEPDPSSHAGAPTSSPPGTDG